MKLELSEGAAFVVDTKTHQQGAPAMFCLHF